MNTNPGASEQQSINPMDIHCPRCGNDSAYRYTTYWNPQTGAYAKVVNESGCIIWFLMWLVSVFVTGFIIAVVVCSFISPGDNPYENPLVNNAVSIGCLLIVFVPIVSAFIATPLLMWWRNKPGRYDKITHFYCPPCRYKWTVT